VAAAPTNRGGRGGINADVTFPPRDCATALRTARIAARIAEALSGMELLHIWHNKQQRKTIAAVMA